MRDDTRLNEFLARLHPYRYDDNADSAMLRTGFMDGSHYRSPDEAASGSIYEHLEICDRCRSAVEAVMYA